MVLHWANASMLWRCRSFRKRIQIFPKNTSWKLWSKQRLGEKPLWIFFNIRGFASRPFSNYPLASFSKRGLVLNHSYGNEINLHVNETYNYMKGWAPELALKTRPKVIRKWPIGWTYSDKLLTIKHNTTSSRKDIQVHKIRRGTARRESRK